MRDLTEAFAKCRAYVTSQISKHEEERGIKAGEHPRPAVTLSRMTGAGAVTLAEKLAEYLTEHDRESTVPWAVFDKNLVKKVLQDHNLPGQLERFMPEDRPKMVEEAFTEILGLRPSDWTLFEHTRDTIYRLARLGNVILVGRGSSVITQSLPNVLRIRLIAPLEKRIPRCQQYYNLSKAGALDFIKKEDRARRRYVRAYFDKDIDNPMHYHMLINVDHFTDEAFVDLIGKLILEWGKKL